MLSLRVYLVNGKHVDVDLEDLAKSASKPATKADTQRIRAAAETLAQLGVWTNERGEDIFYPAPQILYVRLVKDKSHGSS